ncbi:AMP-binding protein [Streptomyces stramineus]
MAAPTSSAPTTPPHSATPWPRPLHPPEDHPGPPRRRRPPGGPGEEPAHRRGGRRTPAPRARPRRPAARPHAALVNEYGPTETVVGCCARTVDESAEAGTAGVGEAITGLTACVVDDGAAAPAGVLGELYIGGTGVTRGYLGRPAATAAAYGPDPSVPGARRYRTGDLARRLPDGGGLLLAGRADRQVKIRGYRTEPGRPKRPSPPTVGCARRW